MIGLLSADSEQLRIEVEGRIDSQNAGEVGKELTALRAAHPQGRLILCCEGLRYISSAGLRVLLRLQKQEKQPVVMQKVSPEVNEILTLTGFHKMLQIEKGFSTQPTPGRRAAETIITGYMQKTTVLSPEDLNAIDGELREIGISGAEIIGKGTTGCVYRLGNEDIIKVYNKGMSLAAILKEIKAAKKAFIRGVPTAISYDVVKLGECYGSIFEKIQGDTLAKTMHREPEHYDGYVAGYADLFKKIHTTEAEAGAFPSAKKIFMDAAEKCTAYYSTEETGIFKKLIAGIPDTNTLVHRDYHPKNIMVSEGKLLLIDMADVCTGHPVFDWMGIIATHQFFGSKFPEAVTQNMGMSPEECSSLKDSLFRLYFPGRGERELKEIIRQAELYSRVLNGISPALRPEQDEIVNRVCVQEARENLFPYVSELAGAPLLLD